MSQVAADQGTDREALSLDSSSALTLGSLERQTLDRVEEQQRLGEDPRIDLDDVLLFLEHLPQLEEVPRQTAVKRRLQDVRRSNC